MKKRIIAMLLAMIMLLGAAACGGGQSGKDTAAGNGGDTKSTKAETQKEGGNEEMAELVVAFRTTGSVPEEGDLARVEAAINEITREKINCEIKLLIVQTAAFQQQMTLMLSGDEKLDVLNATPELVATAAAAEQLRDISSLLEEYGQGIKSVMDDDFLACGKFEGSQYCIPVLCDTSLGLGYYVMRKDIVDELGIDVEQIKSYEDLTEAFALVHEKYPDMTVVAPKGAGVSFLRYSCEWDKLGDNFGVLDNYGQDELEVVNLFETDTYRRFVDVMRDWYLKGYISPDVANSAESGPAQMKAGTLFSYAISNKPGINTQESMDSGREVVGAQVINTITWTANNAQWTIPENCEYPEKAMQFIDLMYTDADLLNCITYGIEGEDYVIHEDGRIGYPEGKDITTVGYSQASMLWGMGNEFNAHVWETNAPDIWEQTKEWNKTGLVSKAFGFVFNSNPVANEKASVQNVYNQYTMSLECGIVDPDSILDEMNEKLKAAGLDKIIKEKQRQLDLWAADNGKQ